MAKGFKKKIQYIGLDRLNVYSQDTEPTSKYFKVSGVPDTLPIGKSSFIVRGSKWLKAFSDIKVEVIDVNRNVIYSEFVVNEEVAGGRPVTIEVYNDTPVGLATIHIVGEIKGVPRKWRGIYNARWSKKIFVDSTSFNKQPIKFYKKPHIDVIEKNVYYRQFHDDTIKTKTISWKKWTDFWGYNGMHAVTAQRPPSLTVMSDEVGMKLAIERFPTQVKNLINKYGEDYLASPYLNGGDGYALISYTPYSDRYMPNMDDEGNLQAGGSFEGPFRSYDVGRSIELDATITGSGTPYAQYLKRDDGIKTPYSGSIVAVYNSNMVLCEPAFKDNTLTTGSLLSANPDKFDTEYQDKRGVLKSTDYVPGDAKAIDFTFISKTPPSESLMTPDEDNLSEGMGVDKSYARLTIHDLETYSGEISRIQVFAKKSRAQFAEPEMVYDGVVPSAEMMREFNDPPLALSPIGSFKTGSLELIGSGSTYEHWYRDKCSITSSNPSNPGDEGLRELRCRPFD